MNAKIKEEWIAALKSGEYQHGKHRLRIGSSFCCLGVLCDLHGESMEIDIWKQEPSCSSYLGQTAALPVEVKRWADLDSVDCIVLEKLADENDYSSNYNTAISYIENKL